MKDYFIWTYDKDLDLTDHIRNMRLDNIIVERTKIVNGILIQTNDHNHLLHIREYCKEHGLMIRIDRDQPLQAES